VIEAALHLIDSKTLHSKWAFQQAFDHFSLKVRLDFPSCLAVAFVGTAADIIAFALAGSFYFYFGCLVLEHCSIELNLLTFSFRKFKN